MAFTRVTPTGKLVQTNFGVPWATSVLVDDIADVRKCSKAEVYREALRIGLLAMPEAKKLARDEAKPSA